MEMSELEQIIEKARRDRVSELDLRYRQITILPDSIGNLNRLMGLYLENNQLINLPHSFGNLTNLTILFLQNNQLFTLTHKISNLVNLNHLNLSSNQLLSLPDSLGNSTKLKHLELENNKLNSLPESLANLTNLVALSLNDNPLTDLSALETLLNLEILDFLDINLSRRYWTKLSEWKPQWLLDETNAEMRRILIEHLGYEKICEKLNAVTIDSWREYNLLKIDEIEPFYDEYDQPIEREPMVLLKMSCPSTDRIHILRVPPQMTSAEEAITWVNHGIHPDEFTVQT